MITIALYTAVFIFTVAIIQVIYLAWAESRFVEKRKVKDGVTPNGDRLQTFTYIWEQVDYNPINHHLTCHIHFKFKDGTRINKAFTYHWRLWTIPELRELLEEAGFKNTEVYLQGWDDNNDEPDGVFRKRVRYDDWESWYGYIAAIK